MAKSELKYPLKSKNGTVTDSKGKEICNFAREYLYKAREYAEKENECNRFNLHLKLSDSDYESIRFKEETMV